MSEKHPWKTTRVCEECKSYYIPNAKVQKLCSFNCREHKKYREAQEKWLNKKPRVIDHKRNARLEYAAVSKKYTSWMKRFSTCRG